jgi:hypothetical protein
MLRGVSALPAAARAPLGAAQVALLLWRDRGDDRSPAPPGPGGVAVREQLAQRMVDLLSGREELAGELGGSRAGAGIGEQQQNLLGDPAERAV